MRQTQYPDFNEFPPEIILLDEDFDAEMSPLPEYTDDAETGPTHGRYYE
jgi:hypothetical protein